jgi:hypothetical protein
MLAWCGESGQGMCAVDTAEHDGRRYARFSFTSASLSVVFAETWGGIRRRSPGRGQGTMA